MNNRRRTKTGRVDTAFQAAPTQGALFFLAPVTVNEGGGDDAILLELEVVILYDPVLDPKGSELGVTVGLCHVATQTGGLHTPTLASGIKIPCWCGSLLSAP